MLEMKETKLREVRKSADEGATLGNTYPLR